MDRIKNNRVVVFIRMMVHQYFANGVGRTAAELAYFLLFAIFPILIFLNAIIGSLNLSVDRVTGFLSRLLPSAATEIIASYLEYLNSIDTSTFVWLGVVLSIYSIFRVVSSIFYAINLNYPSEHKRPFVNILYTVMFAVALIVMVVLSIALIVTGDWFIDWISRIVNFEPLLKTMWSFLRILIMAALFFFTMLIAYWLAPNKRKRLRDAMWGTVFAMTGMTLITWLFSFYVDNLANFSLLYGSLGTVLIFMLWLYLLGTIMVLGGEMNFVIQQLHQ